MNKSKRLTTKAATAMAIAAMTMVGTIMGTMGMTAMAAEIDNTQVAASEPTREERRAAWIYHELNDGFGEPEEVTPTETTVAAPEVKPAPEKVTISKPETIPHYGEIKRCYFEKGAHVALCLFIYYHPTPLAYEVIEYIEQTIKEGDRGYTIDGVHYDCPENDPYFNGKKIVKCMN